jgi:hypothetical protein
MIPMNKYPITEAQNRFGLELRSAESKPRPYILPVLIAIPAIPRKRMPAIRGMFSVIIHILYKCSYESSYKWNLPKAWSALKCINDLAEWGGAPISKAK